MKKHLITALLISFLIGGVAFGREPQADNGTVGSDFAITLENIEYEPQTIELWFGSKGELPALTISGHESCFDSDRCRMTITFPDGSHKVVIWDIEDKPLKIEMEPLSDADYIKELELKVNRLKGIELTTPRWYFQSDNMPSYPFDWPDIELQEMVPNATE